VIEISSRKRPRKHKVVVNVGSAHVTLSAGHSTTVKVSLNGTGRRLLTSRHVLATTLRVTQSLLNRRTRAVSTQTVTFKVPKKHKHHH
jgi:hypothetical protein